jgi:hypothetical protein
MMYLWVSFKKEICRKIFFYILKVIAERSRIRSWIRIRALARGMDPGIRIRIRTKISQIPNTAINSA